MSNTVRASNERWLLLLSSAGLLMVLFFQLYQTLEPQLKQSEQALTERQALLLRPGITSTDIRNLLLSKSLYADEADVALVADSLSARIYAEGSVPNLGAINKRSFAVVAPLAWKSAIGGRDFQRRLEDSRIRLGFDSATYVRELGGGPASAAVVKIDTGSRSISGNVMREDGSPFGGVLLQLREHIAMVGEDSVKERLFYAHTDADGAFRFTGLRTDSGYSVLPLKPGFEFGARKGSAQLSNDQSFDFTAAVHKLRLLSPLVYMQLKEDAALLIRTPDEFRQSYWIIVCGLFSGFLLASLILWWKKIHIDTFILPILLLLTGISILMMFSIQNPLTDTLHAAQALQGVLIGLAGFVVLAFVNVGRLYTRWWFDPVTNLKSRNSYGLKGWTWLGLALLMCLLTLAFGTGPEGSGVKVNLQFGGLVFQPSEITKYLLLLFFSGFFAANEEKIRALSDMLWRFLSSWGVMVGAGAVLMLYLLMGDMGPALVVCCTFLVFYSIARGNLLTMLVSAIFYCVLLNFLPGAIATLIAFVAVIVTMVVQGQLKTGKWYGAVAALVEPPVVILLVIGMFAFGDKMPGIGDRLADRKSMWLDQWNNDVFGGDHLAHSYWTLASGGVNGQGIGKGFPNSMPAAHTDMILPSIGEELGWLGLVAIFLLFAVLVHRILLHARRAGQPFSFYLCAGIGVATAVQLLLIAGGSFGMLPLTGVTVPFLSYGKISLMINLAAMGIVAGISARPGVEKQQEHIRRYYDPVLMAGILGFVAGVVALCVKLFFIQIAGSNEFLVTPARVINRNGLPLYSYNPRIEKLTDLLGAGTIYDRDGRILATSSAAQVRAATDSLRMAGVDMLHLQQSLHRKHQRYYPFENDLFFWTGDYNTRLFWGQANGYFAEARYLTALRGFATNPRKENYVGTEYRPDRFTKPVEKPQLLVSYDYSSLAPLLKTGIDSTNPGIVKMKRQNRDVHLTVDAALQKEIQDSLRFSLFANKRISVVVLDASKGDVMASAVYPLPDLQQPERMLLSERERVRLPMPVTDRDLGMTYATAPGSTAKILTAVAALNKKGREAAEKKYDDIYRPEIFRDNPREQEPFVPKVRYVDMKEAIVNSSNIYFIRLANEFFLENEMGELYQETGMNIGQRGGYSYQPPTDRLRISKDLEAWREDVFTMDRRLYNNPENVGIKKRYRSDFSGLAWGQSKLTSTPAAMARMAASIANHGVLQPSRYVLEESGKPAAMEAGVRTARDSSYAGMLREFMISQSNVPGKQKIKGIVVAGKTGTPERIVRGEKQSDGWYVFFAPTPNGKSHTVCCIRIEEGESSANAVVLGNTVAKILSKRGYLVSF